jgi:hypothetical protein
MIGESGCVRLLGSVAIEVINFPSAFLDCQNSAKHNGMLEGLAIGERFVNTLSVVRNMGSATFDLKRRPLLFQHRHQAI